MNATMKIAGNSSNYDTWSSPANLQIEGEKSETPSYPLCEGMETLQHFLSNRSKAQRRGVRWIHDQVLGVIAEINNTAIRTSIFNSDMRPTSFVRAGHKAPALHKKDQSNKLSSARGWQLLVDK